MFWVDLSFLLIIQVGSVRQILIIKVFGQDGNPS